MNLRSVHGLYAAPLAFAVSFLAGCSAYHWGSVMHPQVKTLAVGQFSNDTQESALTACLRQHIAEQVMTDGSLKVVSASEADMVVQGRIVQCLSKGISSSKRRLVSDGDRDSYQITIFRAQVQIEFEAVIPGRTDPLIPKQQVTGYADYSRLPDLRVAQQEALRQATVDAAARVVNAITEAW